MTNKIEEKHSDIGHIDNNALVYYCFGKKISRILVRQLVIFLILLLSFFLFNLSNFSSEEKPSPVKENKSVTLDTALYGAGLYPDDDNKSIPEDVLNFIGSYNSVMDSSHKDKSSKIVIYEIVENVDNSEKVALFLKEAKKFLDADKLTVPKGNNAFERYEMVLALDPGNQQALNGIEKIVDRYVDLTDYVIGKGESYKAASFIKGAYKVGNKYMDMKPIIDKYSKYINDKKVFSNISLNKHKLKDSSAVSTIVTEIFSESESIITIDENIAKTANRLLTDGNIEGAISVLERFSELSDYWAKSYDMLLDVYLQQSMISKAEGLVGGNKTLDIFQLAEKISRVFIASGDKEGAFKLLDSHTPDIAKYQRYYAIKAGLYYHRQKFLESIVLYKKLIALDYDNPRYWLGLAVSLDSIGDEKAVEAFRYADDYAMKDLNVKYYIENRLLSLNE